jgi:hypothetical protein
MERRTLFVRLMGVNTPNFGIAIDPTLGPRPRC